jgi:transcriptional regulator with XRE-family HTH domain
MNINSSLIAELREKAYRDAYVASQIRMTLPLQVRGLRKRREWTQPELAEHAGMAQPRISELEKPGERRLTIETLLRLASAFDVALQVRFVPFSELIDWSEDLDIDNFAVQPFDAEVAEAERAAILAIPRMPPARVQARAAAAAAGAGMNQPTAEGLYRQLRAVDIAPRARALEGGQSGTIGNLASASHRLL